MVQINDSTHYLFVSLKNITCMWCDAAVHFIILFFYPALWHACVHVLTGAPPFNKIGIGKLLTKVLEEKGIIMVSWVWQAGGVATRSGPIILPDDIKGVKVRGGSREFDAMLKAAGGSVMTSIPSNEVYQAMQTGSIEAAYTSSASLMSFKLAELSKNFTSAKNKSYWYMLEPLMMSKSIFDSLPKNQRDIIMAVGSDMEKFGTEQAKLDDIDASIAFAKASNKVFELDSSVVDKWKAVAQKSAWKEFSERNETCAAMMRSAEKIS